MNTAKSIIIVAFILIFIFGLRTTFSQVSVHISTDCELSAEKVDISLSGDWYNDGDYTSQSSRLIFNGNADQYLYQSADKNLEYLKVDKIGSALYLTDTLRISDSLSLTKGKILVPDTALLLMLPAAGSSGGDSVSFVDGPMAKVYAISGSPDPFIFPTGDNLDYRPVTVQFGTVADDSIIVTVKQVNEDAKSLSTNYFGVDKVSSVRYWHIDKSGIGSFTQARATFSYDTTFTDDGVEIGAELRIVQLDTSATWIWNEIGGIGSADNKGTIMSTEFSDFLSGYFTFGDALGGSDISLPVLLSLFELSENRGEVSLSWKTESEINNQTWLVQKKEHLATTDDETGQEETTTSNKFETIAKLDGQGTKPTETMYAFLDNAVSTGKQYSYRLVDISINGRKHFHDEQSIVIGLPKKYELFQNYPNPFNPITNILYDLPVNSEVHLDIYNILGQKVATLVTEKQLAWFYKLLWDGKNVHGNKIASGMYILAIRAAGVKDGEKQNFYKVKKMVMVK
jgi:hypothetical protein